MRQVHLRDLGLCDYKEAWDYQEKIFQSTIREKMARRQAKNPEAIATKDHLLLVEHPHVYTLGKSGHMAHLLANEDELGEIGAAFYKINRGGDITYHGPGQLVAYPILDLDHFFTDIHRYLRYLEGIIIQILSGYGLRGMRSKGETGVWLDAGTPFARKICAMGVRTSRWVTMHGLAFNINTDLGYFDQIIPCGIENKAITSLQCELKREVPMSEVKEKFKKCFESVFEVALTPD